jgi:methyl-accepting chemotaxis protein
MIVPTIATIVIGVQSLFDHIQEANNADRAYTLAVLSGDAGHLVHQLQEERVDAVKLLNAPPNAPANTIERLRDDYEKQQTETETANADYRFRRSTLADVPDNLRELLDRIEAQLSELSQLRSQVADRDDVSLTIAEDRYGVLVQDLLEIRDLSAQLTGDTTLTDRMRAAAAVATLKEELSKERVVVLLTLDDGDLSQGDLRSYIDKRVGQERAEANFNAIATPAQALLWQETVTGADLRETGRYEEYLDAARVGPVPADAVPLDKWDQTMLERSNLINEVEVELNEQAQIAATERGDVVQRQVLIETGVLLITLLLGVLFAWVVARSMARSLRDLRQGALAVAQYGLPQAVARLRDPALSSQLSPQQIAAQIADALPVRSKDEFGQVTEAFNAVHMEAVRTAAEQAALRSSVATMFVNLARRSQILVDRLIGHLDRLERGEQDPDRLSELFQLDHLATRMRRNDENLLVLAGADSTRIQREPAALVDVLRAAQSEVEHYTRVQFGVIDADIEIAAHAVNDLVHLVAELFDNATAFSPPDSSVLVEARRVGDRAVLQVEDRGIGMSGEQYAELNDKLATPPMVDVAVSRMMGLVVVARLANRHNVKVELRPSLDRGTVADVMLPGGVLVPRALAGRSQAPSGFPASRPVPTEVPPRPMFPAPLALESSSAGQPGAPLAASAAGWSPEAPPPGLFATSYPPPGNAPSMPPMGSTGIGGGHGGGGHGGGLGAALADNGFGAPLAPANGGNGGNGGRGLPAWHDLTGVSDRPPTRGWDSEPGDMNPLPHRQPNQAWPENGEGPGIPRQMPTSPEARADTASVGFGGAPSGAPYGTPPAPYLPPPMAEPGHSDFGVPAAARPPTWPPVTSDDSVAPTRASEPDFTAEMPAVRADAPEAAPTPPSRYADDLTMELPIFRELESAWFRVTGSFPQVSPTGGDTSAPTGAVPDAAPASPAPAGAGGRKAARPKSGITTDSAQMAGVTMSTGTPRPGGIGGTAGAAGPGGEVTWRTVADDGWSAAQAAARPSDGGTTEIGLPKRVPMAQLVPGGVETPAGGPQRRTPDSVRGLLSAYTRGVQRGRGAHGNQADSTASAEAGGHEGTDSSREQEA